MVLCFMLQILLRPVDVMSHHESELPRNISNLHDDDDEDDDDDIVVV